jgi:protein-tyrosine phosphatase
MDKESTNLIQHFDECFNYIEEAKRSGGGVLVHCFVGKSRR